jgi:hypothetical protein
MMNEKTCYELKRKGGPFPAPFLIGFGLGFGFA